MNDGCEGFICLGLGKGILSLAKIPSTFKYKLSGENIKREFDRQGIEPITYANILGTYNNLNQITDLRQLCNCFQVVGNPNVMDFSHDTDGVKRFNTVKESLNFVVGFKNKFNELNERYRKLSEGIKLDYRTKYKDKDPEIKDPKFRTIVQEMCGGNSGLFWYGDNVQSYKFGDYQKARSILARLGILYLPWYDISFVEKIMDEKRQVFGFVNEFHKLQSKNLKGDKNDPTGNFRINDDNGDNYRDKFLIDKGLSIENISIISGTYIFLSIVMLFIIKKKLNPQYQ